MRGLREHPRRMALVGALLIGLLLLALFAARALSGSDAGRTPADVTPSDAALYAAVDLRPDDDQSGQIRGWLGHVVGRSGGPSEGLGDALDQVLGAAGATGLRYRPDVEPWLGRHAGIFVRRLGAPRASYAVLLEAGDADQARAALDRLDDGGPPATRRTVAGVPVAVRPDGLSWGIVDGYAVLGPQAGVRAAAQAASDDGFALGDADRYVQAIAKREAPVALLYVDVKHLVEALPPALLGPQAQRDLRLRLARVEDKPIVISASALSDRDVAIDLATPPGTPDPGDPPVQVGGGLDGTSLLPTRLLPRLPADAWLALDTPELGQRVFDAIDPRVNPGLPSGNLAGLQRRLAASTGISLRRDVVAWLGGGALFVRGSPARGLASLDGGVVLESLDPPASRRTVAALGRYLAGRPGTSVGPLGLPVAGTGFSARVAGLPARLFAYARGNRVVLALGARAAFDALDAPRKLGQSAAYRHAAGQLGGTLLPGAWVDLPAVTRLAGALALARTPWFRAAAPYLERMTYVMFGAKRNKRRILLGAG